MTKTPRYCTHIMVLLMSLFLAACGDSSSSTSVASETSPSIFYSHSVAALNQVPLAWGYNKYGQLGNSSSDNSSSPVAVSGLAGITGMAAGGTHSVAFRNHSTVWAWGNNGFGQLGNDSTTASSLPVQVVTSAGTPLTNVIAVSAGGNHTLALDGDGVVWAWGQNVYGQLGDNTSTNQDVAVRVLKDAAGTPLSGVTMIAAGGGHSLALLADRTVVAWGNNVNGQLGNNSTTNSEIPVPVVVAADNTTLTDVVAIAAGGSHCLALKADGTLWAWGFNHFGQLGLGMELDANGNEIPQVQTQKFAVQVIGFTGPLAPGDNPIAAGLDHSLAVAADGSVWGWGFNFYGQLGNGKSGSNAAVSVPVQVLSLGAPLTGVSRIVAVGHHSLAQKTDGTLWAWGVNTFGQLGDGTTTNSSVPRKVAGSQ